MAKRSYMYQKFKFTSVFHHLLSVGPKKLCALAHLGCTREVGTSQFTQNHEGNGFVYMKIQNNRRCRLFLNGKIVFGSFVLGFRKGNGNAILLPIL